MLPPHRANLDSTFTDAAGSVRFRSIRVPTKKEQRSGVGL